MDVLTFETCLALNNEIKQVTSSWSIFIQLSRSNKHKKTLYIYLLCFRDQGFQNGSNRELVLAEFILPSTN